MNKQLQKWVEQSTSDEVFFAMTDKEVDERTDRLAHKTLNGIIDAEVIAADKRAYRNIELLFIKFFGNFFGKIIGKFVARKIKKKLGYYKNNALVFD
jgi:hypothetical protein